MSEKENWDQGHGEGGRSGNTEIGWIMGDQICGLVPQNLQICDICIHSLHNI